MENMKCVSYLIMRNIKCFLSEIENKQGCLHSLLLNILLKVQANGVRQGKEKASRLENK